MGKMSTKGGFDNIMIKSIKLIMLYWLHCRRLIFATELPLIQVMVNLRTLLKVSYIKINEQYVTSVIQVSYQHQFELGK